jgi:hypothetical protein
VARTLRQTRMPGHPSIRISAFTCYQLLACSTKPLRPAPTLVLDPFTFRTKASGQLYRRCWASAPACILKRPPVFVSARPPGGRKQPGALRPAAGRLRRPLYPAP